MLLKFVDILLLGKECSVPCVRRDGISFGSGRAAVASRRRALFGYYFDGEGMTARVGRAGPGSMNTPLISAVTVG